MGNCLECGKGCRNKFCDNVCSGKHIGRIRHARKTSISTCNVCKKQFEHPTRMLRKFCSRSCTQTFNNTLRKKHVCCKCKQCGILLKNPYRKFCNRECSFEYARDITKQRINNGEIVHSGTLRKLLIRERGEHCELCGWKEQNALTKKIPIQVHHKDGNWKNNKSENLILLCPNCHSLTPTFGALNIGNGREKRRLKYKRLPS